ncbi:MAG: DUF1631 domain-containing protein [Burkholderiaceae bacterium]|jgi:hypothetical protein|nr:DUF1631 domain-containing protein [Burkholderiaceae bacterium]
MSTPPRPPASQHQHRLARQARERFIEALDEGMTDLVMQVQGWLSGLLDKGAKTASINDIALILEADRSFQAKRRDWVEAMRKTWREPAAPAPSDKLDDLALEDGAVIERKIIASRLANAVSDTAGPEINHLRLRIQHLEGESDWTTEDPLRPETLPTWMIKAWLDCGLTQPMWNLALPAIKLALSQHMTEAYRTVNQYLIDHDVMAEIDLRTLVKRDRQGKFQGGPGSTAASTPPQAGGPPPAHSHGQTGMWHHPPAARGGESWSETVPPHVDDEYVYQDSATGTPVARQTAPGHTTDQYPPVWPGITPMTRMRERAQGVFGQLRRILMQRIPGFDLNTSSGPPSPRLVDALKQPSAAFEITELMEFSSFGDTESPSGVQVQSVAAELRHRATELKHKADKPSEKALIEIVALMFQAILAEEHIPPSIRVWFARLQIPVLRLALAEPDFFVSMQHPARQLIDSMGACAMGFDATQVSGSRLEREIKRIVQVVEQYPETGRRVYQLVLDEFRKFLGHSLTEGQAVQQAATLAQQVEQKEALSIQYTIELRRMLEPVPVGDEVREFLFHIWSNVLAMAAVRHGPQHAETLRFKQAAVDLLWLVSPRSNRAERGFVLQKLPSVIAVLREGMATLIITNTEQDSYIKQLNDAVMQAFVSRAEAISQATLNELARGLAALEDVVSDDPQGEILLDTGMIGLMFDINGEALEVITDGGSREALEVVANGSAREAPEVIADGGPQPSEDMLRWAGELELGTWFSLNYRGALVQVQYVWHSISGQLHLLVNNAGKSYLIQTRRLASYLQAGLLAPVENEALTVRATRHALAKLSTTSGQLLQ